VVVLETIDDWVLGIFTPTLPGIFKPTLPSEGFARPPPNELVFEMPSPPRPTGVGKAKLLPPAPC
jgi:hypothetical protein